ncbi:peroxisomal sarcosine oxidase-like isoform X2 [Anneissia japonica]|uniref:peroxisomal sarcosine oxidase-like isoform X2 n=1 Tax=Anneissia japonica TaxID=1529436 RepID=UPI001425B252|nr:peroxisomal sarcosine oxidase-like isoform X2 [Anneissia japonica]
MEEFDVCIVGAGTWGSAAAYHLTSGSHNLSVCLIGPEEPEDRSKATIFGSYYDEGRITKCAEKDTIWGELAKRSIEKYRDIERKSGISFFHDVGLLFIGSQNATQQIKSVYSTLRIQSTELSSQDINKKFPFLAIKEELSGLYSRENDGYINIRQQRLAHQGLAKCQGCKIISDIVESIQDTPCGREMHLLLTTKTSIKIHSKRVLLTTGCFTGFNNLLPTKLVPDMLATTDRVLLLEMSSNDVERLKSMPSLIYRPNDPSNACYILPPIRYPDGKYYLKIGHSGWGNKALSTNDAIVNHFRTRGPSSVGLQLYKILKKIMADFNVLSIKYDSCVSGKTATGYLYCDMKTYVPDWNDEHGLGGRGNSGHSMSLSSSDSA